jgi:hypothetical protein
MSSRAATRDNAEQRRLRAPREGKANWNLWGPYLAERQWGTVREDYSEQGAAWESFPHDHARSRAYRWGEDGLLGICDDHGRLCFSLELWNGRDRILKERLFGLTNSGPAKDAFHDYVVDGRLDAVRADATFRRLGI